MTKKQAESELGVWMPGYDVCCVAKTVSRGWRRVSVTLGFGQNAVLYMDMRACVHAGATNQVRHEASRSAGLNGNRDGQIPHMAPDHGM